MSVPFSQVPSTLLMDPDMTLTAVRVWHVIYCETLGRPGWDLSYGQIAEKIGSPRRQTAMEAVRLLLEKGWLVRTQRKDAAGDDAPNLFAVCREPFTPWNAEGDVRQTAQGGTPQRTTPVRQTAQGGTPERTTGGAPQRTHRENHLPGDSQSAPKSQQDRQATTNGKAKTALASLSPDERTAWAAWAQTAKPGIRNPLAYPWQPGEVEALIADWRNDQDRQAAADAVEANRAIVRRLAADDADDDVPVALYVMAKDTLLLTFDDLAAADTIDALKPRLDTPEARNELAHLRTYSRSVGVLADRLGITLTEPTGQPATFSIVHRNIDQFGTLRRTVIPQPGVLDEAGDTMRRWSA